MSKYMQYGDIIVENGKVGTETEVIPAGTYKVAVAQQIGFHLTKSSMGGLPSKLYGEVESRTQRILTTFKSRSELRKNTGVMLSGEKGSGKTLLAKNVSFLAAKEGIPTIIVDSSFGENTQGMVNLLANISQPCVILFDEFDKTFAKKEQQDLLLTLIDGMSEASKLFVFTRNSGFLSEFFVNRPSRVFYSFNYDKISLDSLVGYVEDNIQDKKFIRDFVSLHEVCTQLSFDVVQGIVEELNRFPETTFKECLDLMGVELTQVEYMVAEFKHKGKSRAVTAMYGFSLHKLLSKTGTATIYLKEEEDMEFEDYSITSVTLSGGNVVYHNKEDDVKVTFVQKPASNTFVSRFLA